MKTNTKKVKRETQRIISLLQATLTLSYTHVNTVMKVLVLMSVLADVLVVSRVRQAIEGFAVMVKKTAQTLQSFGTELAETELPNEIQATTVLLSTHTNKKEKMKVAPSACTLHIYSISGCMCVMCLDDISPSVCRGICWWLWVRAAGCWRASTSP